MGMKTETKRTQMVATATYPVIDHTAVEGDKNSYGQSLENKPGFPGVLRNGCDAHVNIMSCHGKRVDVSAD